MRIILFFSIAFSCFEFVGCMPMNSGQKVIANEEKKIDSSLIKLAQKIRDADTILLTSHTGITFDTTGEGMKVIELEIMIGSKINRKIIKQQRIITDSDIDTLINIVSIPKPDIDSLSTACWDPHHSIFIIKREIVSYIDICFHCANIATSDDLKSIRTFGSSKWTRLIQLFKRYELEYKLPSTIHPKDE